MVVDNYEYGLLTSEIKGYGTAQAATTRDLYDPNTLGRTSEQDPNGNTTTSTLDPRGNVLTITDPLGRETINTYNGFNELLSSEDPNQVASLSNGATTHNTYDTKGNLTSTYRALTLPTGTQTVTYNHVNATFPGDVTSMVDGDGKTTSYAYDSHGDRTQVTDPLANTTTAVYNGDGWPTTTYSPKATAAAATASQLQSAGVNSSGNGFAVARRSDGTVWTQGANWGGQLGNGTWNQASTPQQVCASAGSWTPCNQYLTGVVSVAGGFGQSVAAKSDGTVWAWGYNGDGELGTGDTNWHNAPVQVTGLSGVTITQVAAGQSSSYGLASDGTVWAWGANGSGQLGNGSTAASLTPVHVCAPGATVPCTSFLSNVKSISTDNSHVLALKTDGTVWAWGDNTWGQVGTGSFGTNATEPVAVCAVGQSAPCSSHLSSVSSIAAGQDFSAALTSSGTVDVWGTNYEGEQANGSTDSGAWPIPVTVSGLSSVSTLAVGGRTVVTIQSNGTMRSWGHNGNGELGIGTVDSTGCSCEDTVQTVLNVANATAISSGEQTSFAITSDGSTWSWGDDNTGELGNGSTGSNSATPTKFTGISGAPDGNYGTTTTYDALGHPVMVVDPLGNITGNVYDADGNLIQHQDPNQWLYLCGTAPSPCTHYTYDVAGELTTMTRADGTTNVTDYNADGTVLDQKDGKGHAIQSFGYDSLARVTTVTDALGNITTSTYDGAGNQLTKKDPVTGAICTGTKIGCTTSVYDAANQLVSVTYSDGTTPNVTGITYDSDGQRTAMTDGTGTTHWVYDSLHRVTSSTNGNGAQVQSAYNLRNLPTTVTYPGTTGAVTNGYDAAGRMTSVQDWNGKQSTFGYDVNSNLTTETLPTSTGVVDATTFDAANALKTIADAKGGTTIFAATYTRDAASQLTSDTSVPSTVGSYSYTPLNQLCYAGSANSAGCSTPPSGSYPYSSDTADNLTKTENAGHTGSVTQSFNNADELCWTVAGSSAAACASPPSGATKYGYDTRGDRTSATTSANAGTCDGFDQAMRLTSIKRGTGSTCTTPTTVGSYGYNGDGVKTSKTVGANTTQFAWGGSLLLQEKTGTSTTSYIYGPGGAPLELITPAAATYYYHHDQLGSTRALTDASGVAQATDTYDPYGNLTASTGSVVNPLLFSGQYKDSESGLYYLRARYYDPTTAQFMSLDPMVASTMSPYAYVAGNPLNNSDPSGLQGGPCAFGPRRGDGSCPPPPPHQSGPTTGGKCGVPGGCNQGFPNPLDMRTDRNYGQLMGGFFNVAYGTTYMVIGGTAIVLGTAVTVMGIEIPPVAVGGVAIAGGGLLMFGMGASRVHKGGDEWADFAKECNQGAIHTVWAMS